MSVQAVLFDIQELRDIYEAAGLAMDEFGYEAKFDRLQRKAKTAMELIRVRQIRKHMEGLEGF